MKITEFKIGQKVKMNDEDDGSLVVGLVKNIGPDSSNFHEQPYVSIHWEDLNAPVNHYADEFEKIQDASDFTMRPNLNR